MKIRTRFAPSPTGNLHLGNIRTAFYSWLFARGRGGEFILRIEDTDQERSTQTATQLILDSMQWLGLDYDADPFYQSKRLDKYRKTAAHLIEQGLAYRCTCSKERLDNLREQQLANKEKPRYDGHCRDKNLQVTQEQPHVIRFKNPPTGSITFDDQVLGKLTFQNSELDDLVIIRTDGFPTYNFCVVIDDHEMQITHVIRGADHVNNTPRQINLFQALGATPPTYAHVPLILGTDGKLLSKRQGAASILQYRNTGFIPEAILNCLVRLGWSHGDQEIFSRTEMLQLFDIKDINKAAAAFDPEKLKWLNRHYIKTLDPQVVATHLRPIMQNLAIDYQHGPALGELVCSLRERVDTLSELAQKSSYFYTEFTSYTEDAKKHLTAEIVPILTSYKKHLTALNSWDDQSLHQVIEQIAKDMALKLGKVAQPMRVVVTGTTVSPPLNVTMRLIGKERVLARIDKALTYLETAK